MENSMEPFAVLAIGHGQTSCSFDELNGHGVHYWSRVMKRVVATRPQIFLAKDFQIREEIVFRLSQLIPTSLVLSDNLVAGQVLQE